MSFDVYMQIVFYTIIPAIIAIIIKKIKRKHIISVIKIWSIIFVVVTLIYCFTKSSGNRESEESVEINNSTVETGNQSPVFTGNGDINITVYSNSNTDTPLETTTVDDLPDTNISSDTINLNDKGLIVDDNSNIATPPNPIKYDIPISVKIYSSTCPEDKIGNYNSNKEKELLYEAKELCESKNYDEAISIYICDVLKDNPYAKINLGYLYAHGYGCDEDIETALKIYDSVDMDIAKRNKLALLITSNTDGVNDAEIVHLIYYFTDKNDYYVQNYIKNCIYSKNVESLSDEEKDITFYLKDLYKLELAGAISSPRTYYLNHAYQKLIYEGINYAWNENHIMSADYNYTVYQYMYLDWLEKIYA